tara:strand:+ start:333 stop:809 length:477 start_codon:yes stop_codon:yes gene_type:complete
MKKLLLVLALATISNASFSQLVSAEIFPEYGDNPLAQEVPHREDATVDMSFIDSLLYKVEQQSPLDQPFILDIESKYNDELNGLYSIDILSYYISEYTGKICIRVDITDKIFYMPAVFVHRQPGDVGGFQIDLYGIETSFQNGTLLEDIQKVFKVLNK